MDLGHGFIPRLDARNYKAVERCLARDGPGMFHEGLDLPWAILEGPWAVDRGTSTLELCRDRGVSYLVDTQAWRYHDPRTFEVEKFATTPSAPPQPLSCSDPGALRDFVEADLSLQASLDATAFLLPGMVPRNRGDDISDTTLTLLDAARDVASGEPRPCIAFLGAHTGAMEVAHRLVDDLPVWITGVYLQLTPVKPLHDSPSKIIDCLALMRHLVQRGFSVVGGRLAGLGLLAYAAGVHATDAGLGEGESFDYNAKLKNHQPRGTDAAPPRPLGGRMYVPQLGRSVSAAEWDRLMQVPALRGQLLCRLPCCAFGQPIQATPSRGREHSLHTRVAEANETPASGSSAALGHVVRILEQRHTAASAMTHSLEAAGLEPLPTAFINNHLAAAQFLHGAISDVA